MQYTNGFEIYDFRIVVCNTTKDLCKQEMQKHNFWGHKTDYIKYG